MLGRSYYLTRIGPASGPHLNAPAVWQGEALCKDGGRSVCARRLHSDGA